MKRNGDDENDILSKTEFKFIAIGRLMEKIVPKIFKLNGNHYFKHGNGQYTDVNNWNKSPRTENAQESLNLKMAIFCKRRDMNL